MYESPDVRSMSLTGRCSLGKSVRTGAMPVSSRRLETSSSRESRLSAQGVPLYSTGQARVEAAETLAAAFGYHSSCRSGTARAG